MKFLRRTLDTLRLRVILRIFVRVVWLLLKDLHEPPYAFLDFANFKIYKYMKLPHIRTAVSLKINFLKNFQINYLY